MLWRGICSAEMLLSVVGAGVWAEIRYCCGSWCCAAWLKFHLTFFPLLTFLWSLLGADTAGSLLLLLLQVPCSAKLQAQVKLINSEWKIPVFHIAFPTLVLLEVPRQGLKGHCSGSVAAVAVCGTSDPTFNDITELLMLSVYPHFCFPCL